VILIISAIFFALIFPIFVSVFAVLSKTGENVKFEAYIYGVFHVFKGKVVKKGGVLIIKHSFNKGKIIPVYDVFTIKKSVKPLNDYHIISFRSLTKTGINVDLFVPVTFANVFCVANNIVGDIIYENKPYLKIKNDLCLYENENCFNIYIKTVFLFNLLVVILNILKILIGKLFYAIKRQR